MRSKLSLLLLASAVAACQHTPADLPDRGYAAVNVPVVTQSNFTMDVATPDGVLNAAEAARLDGWFHGLQLGYGDSIYVDGAYAPTARSQIAAIAGNYGMLVGNGSPVTAGMVAPGTVRIVVTRAVASVPNCPNWGPASQPNYNNRNMSNYGCAVNANLAAMVANPQDLVHGREGSGVGDAATATKAVGYYRSAEPTGTRGLNDVTTKKDK